MIIDTSAVLAIIFNEPEAQIFRDLIYENSPCKMSAATLFEASMVAEGRLGPAADVANWAASVKIVIWPVDEEQSEAALQAWRKFGKGRHKAALNFGDCFSYALAKSRNEKLLFKGNDFSQTDIAAA
jgi:ribonuclease VapC